MVRAVLPLAVDGTLDPNAPPSDPRCANMTSPATASPECKEYLSLLLFSCPRDRTSISPEYRFVGNGQCETALDVVPAHTTLTSGAAVTEAGCKEACSDDEHCAAFSFGYGEKIQKQATCNLFSRTHYAARNNNYGPFGWQVKKALGDQHVGPVRRCEDGKFDGGLNFCTEWCNKANWPHCGEHTMAGSDDRNTDNVDYTCSCDGCGGCGSVFQQITGASHPDRTSGPGPGTLYFSLFIHLKIGQFVCSQHVVWSFEHFAAQPRNPLPYARGARLTLVHCGTTFQFPESGCACRGSFVPAPTAAGATLCVCNVADTNCLVPHPGARLLFCSSRLVV